MRRPFPINPDLLSKSRLQTMKLLLKKADDDERAEKARLAQGRFGWLKRLLPFRRK